MRLRISALAIATCISSAPLAPAPLSAQNPAPPADAMRFARPRAEISVSATGETKVTPDRATIQISMQTRASTAAAAASENARRSQRVLTALRSLGLASDQLSTTNYNVSPEYQYGQNRAPTVIGYTATNTVVAELKELRQVGPAIDTAVASGANLISSLQFFASNTDAARRSAIASAVATARADADAAARAAGGTVGELVLLSVGANVRQPPVPYMAMRGAAMADAAVSTPVNPGDQTVSASVSTSWVFLPTP